MHAVLSKREAMAALFLEYSVPLRATDVQWGWTALHCAAHVGMDTVVESLLGKRASPYAKSKVNKTPRFCHVSRQHRIVHSLSPSTGASP